MVLSLFFCCFLAMWCGSHVRAQTNDAATSLTMQEAVAIAFENKPNLLAYKHAIQASKSQGMQVWSEYLPQVNVATSVGQQIGQHDPQTTIRLGAQQLLYSFSGPIQKYKKAQKQTAVVELSYDKTKKEVRKAVEEAFIECWKIQQQYKTINAMHTASESGYKTSQHAYSLQLLDKNAWLKVSSARDNTRALVDTYFQSIDLVQRRLEFFMGQPIDLAVKNIYKPLMPEQSKQKHATLLDIVWQVPESYTIKSLTKYYKYAMRFRDELKIADQAIGIAKDDVTIASRANMPTISALASTGYNSVENKVLLAGTPRNYYHVGVQVSWPIFNGLFFDHSAKAAHSTMLKEMLVKDQALQEIKLSIETAYHSLQQAMINLNAKKADRDYAKNNRALKELQLKTGDITQTALNEAIAEQEKIEYEWIELAAAAALKERALAYACGYPPKLS